MRQEPHYSENLRQGLVTMKIMLPVIFMIFLFASLALLVVNEDPTIMNFSACVVCVMWGSAHVFQTGAAGKPPIFGALILLLSLTGFGLIIWF